jgi:large subunit ribosomal protein L21
MKYAIIELAGRQFMVKEGDTLEVTRQADLSCKTLFYKNEGDVKIGAPYLEDILVVLEKIEDKKDDKVVVARYKSKSRYRRKRGHRQPISVVKVIGIGGSVDATEVKQPKQPRKSKTPKSEEGEEK